MDYPIEELPHRLWNTVIYLGEYLFQIAIIIAGAWTVSWFARRWLQPIIARRRFSRNAALLAGRLVTIVAVTGAIFAILGVFGADWTGLLTFLSAFTVAIGLALQDVIRNFFSGILLLFDRPFDVGDRVKIRDIEGEVQGIDVRTTRIRHSDGALVLVPNSIMFSEILTNRSHFQTRRLNFTITTASRSIDTVQQCIQHALGNIEGVRKPYPSPMIKGRTVEETRMEYSLLINADNKVEQAAMRALVEALEDSTIEVNE